MGCGSSKPDCSGWPRNCGALQPDPDIAGIGVFVTFVVSAFVTLCAAVLGMFTAPFAALVKGSLGTTQSQKQPTLFGPNDDGWFIRIAKYDTVLQSLALSFSDQQLITGLSILIVAFNQHCSISAYHFGIIIDIACFSTITHLASLFSLRVFFQERVFLRWLRMSGMTAILIMIIAGTVIKNQSQFSDALTCPVQCSINKMSETTYSPRFTAGVIVLSLEYLFVLPLMSKSLIHNTASKLTEHITISSSQKRSTQSRSQDKPGRWIDLWRDVRVLTLWWHFWLEMIGPMAIMGLTGNAIWLLVLAVQDRTPPGIKVSGTNTQNVWSFGQLLAVFTLLLPLLNVIEAYQDMAAERGSARSSPNRRQRRNVRDGRHRKVTDVEMTPASTAGSLRARTGVQSVPEIFPEVVAGVGPISTPREGTEDGVDRTG